MSNLTSDIPIVNSPIVDENGMCNQAWFIFFLQLWRRTGGGTSTGGDTTNINFFGGDDVTPALGGEDISSIFAQLAYTTPGAAPQDVLLSDILPAGATVGDLVQAVLPFIDIQPMINQAVNDRITEITTPQPRVVDSVTEMTFATRGIL